MTSGWEGVACRQFQRSFLQTCGDRLHMPGNLEFISPPFLFSVLVIQINSNEISRGKPPLLVGGLQLPVAKSNPMAFSLNEGQTTPPTSLISTYGRMNLRRCHSQTSSLNSASGLRGIFPEFVNFRPISRLCEPARDNKLEISQCDIFICGE